MSLTILKASQDFFHKEVAREDSNLLVRLQSPLFYHDNSMGSSTQDFDCFATDADANIGGGGGIVPSNNNNNNGRSVPPTKKRDSLPSKIRHDFWAGALDINDHFFQRLGGRIKEAFWMWLDAVTILGPMFWAIPPVQQQLVQGAIGFAAIIKKSPVYCLATHVPHKSSRLFRLTALPVLLETFRDSEGQLNEEGIYRQRLWKAFWKVFYTVVVGPAWEEIVFRGPMWLLPIFFEQQKDRMETLALANSALFTLVHFPRMVPHLHNLQLDSPIKEVCIALYSMIFGAVSHFVGSRQHNKTVGKHGLAGTIGAHMTWNLNIMILTTTMGWDLRATVLYLSWRLRWLHQTINYCRLRALNGDESKPSGSLPVYTSIRNQLWVHLAKFWSAHCQEDWHR